MWLRETRSSEKLQTHSVLPTQWGPWTREGVKPLLFRVSPILLSLGQAGQGDSLVCAGAPLGAQLLSSSPPPAMENTIHTLWVDEEPSTHWGRGTTRLLWVSCWPRLGNSERGGKSSRDCLKSWGWGGAGGYPRSPPLRAPARPRSGRQPPPAPGRSPPSQLRADFAPHLLCAPSRGERRGGKRKKKKTNKNPKPSSPAFGEAGG